MLCLSTRGDRLPLMGGAVFGWLFPSLRAGVGPSCRLLPPPATALSARKTTEDGVLWFCFLNKIWTLICMTWRLSLWVSGSSKPSPFQGVVKSLSVKVYFFLTRNKGTLPTKRFFYRNCALLFSSPGNPETVWGAWGRWEEKSSA